jgi:PAS domain S-box-containing protein
MSTVVAFIDLLRRPTRYGPNTGLRSDHPHSERHRHLLINSNSGGLPENRQQKSFPPGRMGVSLCLAILAVFWVASLSLVHAQTSSAKKNVLVLHSYNYGYGWTDSIMKGIESVLSPDRYLLYVEYMDSKRIEDLTYFNKLYDIYKYKFAQTSFDIAIASDDNAFNFLKTHKNDIFNESLSMVFCGVNYFKENDIIDRYDITGVVEEYDMKGTLEIIQEIHKNLQEVIVISDKTATGTANTKKVREVFSNYFPGRKYAVLDDLSMTELLEKISNLPAGSAVLYLGFTRDKTGQNFAPLEESLAVISNKSKAPLYSVWEFTLQSVVGGMITSGFYQGEMAAQMARRILAGERASDIPVMKQSPNVPMFNYRQMERFGITRSQLPLESLVIHAPETSYPVEKHVIIIVTLVLLTLILAVVVLFMNIRKRRQAEKTAQTEKEKYRMLVKQVPGIVFKGYTDYGLDCFDNKIEALTGYTQEEFNSRTIKWDDVLLGEYIAPVKEQLKKALRNDGFFVCEFRIRRKSGELIWVQARNQVVKNARGRIEYISGIFFDITERKRAEDARLDSEEKFRLAFSNANTGMCLVDLQGKLLRVNDKMTEIFGYSRRELESMTVNDLALPEDATLSLEFIHQAVQGTGGDSVTFEKRYRHQQGHIICGQVASSLVRDSHGQPRYFISQVQDITQRKQAEEERRGLEERLHRAEKMEALGTLAGGVAHDLNNVLGIVVGYAELLLKSVDKSSSIRPSLVNIMSGGERAAAIVQDLLTLTRRGVSSRQVLSLNKIVFDFQQSPEFENLSTQHSSVRIKADLEEDPLNISGSSVHLMKTIFNLVSNAIEAMPNGGVLTIKTANQYLDKPIQGYDEVREGDYVVLSVSDTGEGIPAPDLKLIFEPFYTKKVMGRSGTGLGLAVVWGTVKDLR